MIFIQQIILTGSFALLNLINKLIGALNGQNKNASNPEINLN